MKTSYLVLVILLFIFIGRIHSQTEFKKDSIYLYQWDNNTNDWRHNTKEFLAYDNGGTQETNLRREFLSGSNWVNFYQFNKTYTVSNNLEENIRQSWNNPNSGWNDKAKYEYTYDANQNETEYLYSLYSASSGNWVGNEHHVNTYVGNLLDIKTVEKYDYTFAEFVPEDQYIYSYAGDLLAYEIKRIYFADAAAWENDEKIEYTYNTFEQLTDIERFGFNSTTGEFSESPSSKTAITYTPEGLIETYTTQLWATSQYVNYERFAYIYVDGNLTELLQQNWSSVTNDWVNNYRHLKTYDANNNETEFIYENWNTSTDTWKGFLRIVNFWSDEGTLSTGEFSKNMTISVYPNPTKDYLNINSNNTINTVELYDLLGKQILQTNNTEQIDISNFGAGIYLLKITSENLSTTKKIILK